MGEKNVLGEKGRREKSRRCEIGSIEKKEVGGRK